MEDNFPQEIYIAGVNLSGLWSKRPLKAKRYEDTDYWYDKSGNLGVKKLGQDDVGGLITFASTSKKEVQLWIDGIVASFTMMRKWIR